MGRIFPPMNSEAGERSMSTFYEQFQARSAELQSLLCVGLDPDPEKMPAGLEGVNGAARFLSDVITGTSNYAVAYKPNLAFFEAYGTKGWHLFDKIIQIIREKAPGALIIADAKRGDIGNTSSFYAKSFFEIFDCDAITVNPYMGLDTLEPYLNYANKGVIILGLTSNPGAQFLQAKTTPPLYELVARASHELNSTFGNVWLVVGATNEVNHIQKIRELSPDVPFLVPGIGAQGGDLATILRISGINQLINASRSILYAAQEKGDVKQMSGQQAAMIVEMIRTGLENMNQ